MSELESASNFRLPMGDVKDIEIAKLRRLLEEVRQHCLCSRDHTGFDYGEKHALLGAPRIGARWKTPRDLIDDRLKGI